MSGTPVFPAQYEYEICFRCHADSPGSFESYTTRRIEENNARMAFNTGNPSFHPIAGAGKNPDVPSLISHTESSIIYCTDCHASSGGSSPAGPHGSAWQGLLKYRYETADYTSESAENYALCYSCHSRASILADLTFKYHNKHLTEYQTPCNVCHDPHGIRPPGTATNNSNLINFDTDIVFANGPNLRFVDNGINQRACQLTCHGKPHGLGMKY